MVLASFWIGGMRFCCKDKLQVFVSSVTASGPTCFRCCMLMLSGLVVLLVLLVRIADLTSVFCFSDRKMAVMCKIFYCFFLFFYYFCHVYRWACELSVKLYCYFCELPSWFIWKMIVQCSC